MATPIGSSEHEADQHMQILDGNWGPALDRDPFKRLLKRTQHRQEYEDLLAEHYLPVLQEGNGSPLLVMKILRALDRMRSPDVGLHALRLGTTLGPRKRRPWTKATGRSGAPESPSPAPSEQALRGLRSCRTGFPHTFSSPADPSAVDLNWRSEGGLPLLDLANVLLLHLGFVGDGLVVALDANIGNFFYGPEAVADRHLRSKSFADYDYDPASLDPSQVLLGPVYYEGVRGKLSDLAERLHSHIENCVTTYEYESKRDAVGASVAYRRSIREHARHAIQAADDLLGFDRIHTSLRSFAESRDCALKDIGLVILPDEQLFRLPLSFMGSSRGMPLITSLRGVAMALSLGALKWAAQWYHWYTLPNLSSPNPRCAFFAPETSPLPNIPTEVEAVRSAFGADNCAVMSGNVYRRDFLYNYNAADICWFAGHGAWDPSNVMQAGDEVLPFPLGGPDFVDGALTNWDLLRSSDWNFTMLWLSVINACTLGNAKLLGPNPLGFVSALRTAGSISTIAALWPVFDNVAVALARHLASQIVANFKRRAVPRARALSEAISKAMTENDLEVWDFAPYALWGLP